MRHPPSRPPPRPSGMAPAWAAPLVPPFPDGSAILPPPSPQGSCRCHRRPVSGGALPLRRRRRQPRRSDGGSRGGGGGGSQSGGSHGGGRGFGGGCDGGAHGARLMPVLSARTHDSACLCPHHQHHGGEGRGDRTVVVGVYGHPTLLPLPPLLLDMMAGGGQPGQWRNGNWLWRARWCCPRRNRQRRRRLRQPLHN